MVADLILASLVMAAAAGNQEAPQPPADAATETEGRPPPDQTVTGRARFLHEAGKAPFDPVSTEPGMVLVKATISGTKVLASIDLSTERSLVDVNLLRRTGVKLGEPVDSVAWQGAMHERRRAHDVEVRLDGQFSITSDISAIELMRSDDGSGGPLGYVLGRSLLDHMALVLVLMAETPFYGLAESGKWIARTDDGTIADFPYADGIVTLDVDGQPVRLFVDLTSRSQMELTPDGWRKLFGDERSGSRTIRIGPFTREVETGLMFTAPPVEGAEGKIGLGFLESFALVLDGPAKRAHLLGAPVLPNDGGDAP